MAFFRIQQIADVFFNVLTQPQRELVMRLLREPNAIEVLIVLFRRYADDDHRVTLLWQTFVNISVYPKHTVDAFLADLVIYLNVR